MTYKELMDALEIEYPDLTFIRGNDDVSCDIRRGKHHIATYFVRTLLGWKSTMPDGSTALDVAKRDIDSFIS